MFTQKLHAYKAFPNPVLRQELIVMMDFHHRMFAHYEHGNFQPVSFSGDLEFFITEVFGSKFTEDKQSMHNTLLAAFISVFPEIIILGHGPDKFGATLDNPFAEAPWDDLFVINARIKEYDGGKIVPNGSATSSVFILALVQALIRMVHASLIYDEHRANWIENPEGFAVHKDRVVHPKEDLMRTEMYDKGYWRESAPDGK